MPSTIQLSQTRTAHHPLSKNAGSANFSRLSSGFLRLSMGLSVCFMLIVSFSSACFADGQSPEKTLEEILGKIKEAGNASPVVEYVDWDKAFKEAPDTQKSIMKISDANGMKEFYKEVLANPSSVMKKQFESRKASMPESQRTMLEQTFTRMEAMMKEKEKEMKKKIAGTEYTIGEAKIEGDEAKVSLKQEYDGKSRTEEVTFLKSGDRWMLPAVAMLGGEKGARQAGLGGPSAKNPSEPKMPVPPAAPAVSPVEQSK